MAHGLTAIKASVFSKNVENFKIISGLLSSRTRGISSHDSSISCGFEDYETISPLMYRYAVQAKKKKWMFCLLSFVSRTLD